MNVGKVEIGVVVANVALDGGWQGVLESLVKERCFGESGVVGKALV